MEISTQKDDYLTAGHNATQPDATEPNVNRLCVSFCRQLIEVERKCALAPASDLN